MCIRDRCTAHGAAVEVEVLDTLPIEQQSLYLQWKLIDSAASLLNDAMACLLYTSKEFVEEGRIIKT